MAERDVGIAVRLGIVEWQASGSGVGFYEWLGYAGDHVGGFARHPFFEHEFGAAAAALRRAHSQRTAGYTGHAPGRARKA